jgi:hypothetical protein
MGGRRLLAVLVVAVAAAACGRADEPVATGAVAAPAAPSTTTSAAAAATSTTESPAQTGPAFTAEIAEVTAQDLYASWHPGCPVPIADLRMVSLTHWGFDGQPHTGRLVVQADVVHLMVDAFSKLYAAGFAIERMEPVDVYGGSDEASMDANNTSAFNCRLVTGGSTWSEHSYGTAIDINPIQNPYVRGSTVLPEAGRAYLDRTTPAQGKILAGDDVVTTFTTAGWGWGGAWSSFQDFQHFSASGR